MGTRSNEFAGRRLLVGSHEFPCQVAESGDIVLNGYLEKFVSMGFKVLLVIFLETERIAWGVNVDESAEVLRSSSLEVVTRRAERFILPRRRHRLRTSIETMPPDEELKSRIEDFRPDVAFYYDILPVVMLGQICACPKLAWLGDLNFETLWYHGLYAARERPLQTLRLPLTFLEMQLLKRFYRQKLSAMDRLVVASKSSERVLGRLGLTPKYLPYPLNVPADERPIDGPRSELPAKPTFILFGSLSALGARSSFHFLLDKIYPRLVRLWGEDGFEIKIAGRGQLPDWVEQRVSNLPAVTFLGFVDDLHGLMRSCHAALVPIDVPVGNRIRVLNCMAVGTIVVAHENVALGNPALVHGHTCLLAKNADEFVDAMRRTIEQPEAGRAIIRQAKRAYDSLFAPEAATEMMMNELRELVNSPVAR